MREAHQLMIDSLKLQMATFEKELEHIRSTRYEIFMFAFLNFNSFIFRISKQKERETLLKTIEETKLTTRNNGIRHNRFVTQATTKVNGLSERVCLISYSH